MEAWFSIVGTGLGCLIGVTILCFICLRFPLLRILLIFGGFIVLIVISFAMPVLEENGKVVLNWPWIIGQGVCIFLTFVMSVAEIALGSDSDVGFNVFIASLGTALAGTAILLFLNYVIFDSGIGIGILGSIGAAFMLFTVIKHSR